MSKFYTVSLDPATPEKLVKLACVFAGIMLKKGYQVRTGTTPPDFAVLDSVVQEGMFYNDRPEDFGPLCLSTDTKALHQKTMRVFSECVTRRDLIPEKRLACALIFGDSANAPAKMAICYDPSGEGDLIRAANTLNVPVVNLWNKEHRSRLIAMVKETTKKSPLQALVHTRRRK